MNAGRRSQRHVRERANKRNRGSKVIEREPCGGEHAALSRQNTGVMRNGTASLI